MKFRDLAIGQAFRSQGVVYIKTSPLAAAPRDGGATRLFARSAPVEPPGGRDRAPAAASLRSLDPQVVQAAFEALCAEAERQFERCGADAAARAALTTLRERLLRELGFAGG